MIYTNFITIFKEFYNEATIEDLEIKPLYNKKSYID